MGSRLFLASAEWESGWISKAIWCQTRRNLRWWTNTRQNLSQVHFLEWHNLQSM